MDYTQINNIPMFFIVGRARSGTTLLQTLLDAHPSIVIPSESCILLHLKNKYFTCANWDNKAIDTFIEDLLTEKKLRQSWKVDYRKLKNEILEIPLLQRNYILICKILYLNYLSIFNQQNISLIGDKNPIYGAFISDMLELFPQAKFIHIVRDYRANICSNRDVFSLKNIASLAHAWTYHNRKIEIAKTKIPHQFYTLKYEELALDPKTEMKKVFDFLNVGYNDSVFDFYKELNEKAEPKARNRFKKVHGNLLNPINVNRVEVWKDALAEQDIALSEFICELDGRKYGYQSTIVKKANLHLYLKSTYGYMLHILIILVIKLFYYSPFFLKKLYAWIARIIYQWRKKANYFNQTDYTK
ncbi:MAG: sulfotransferase [Bacteroidia bacterium]|nr:sulfotransferase [Bacteroidia bacterium]